MAKFKRRDGELKILTKRVFEQNALGKIDDRTFTDLYNGYQAEQSELTAKMEAIERKMREAKDREANARQFAAMISEYANASELSRDMVSNIFERIVAFQGEGRGVNRQQRLDFYFRFIGRLPDNFFDN